MGFKEKINRYFKYKYYRFLVKLNSKNKTKIFELDDAQKRAYEIVVDLINDKGSNLLYDPLEGDRGILNKDVFIEFNRNKVNIVSNGKPHDVNFDDKTMSELCQKFNEKMSRKYKIQANKVALIVKNSLDEIKNHIEHNKIISE